MAPARGGIATRFGTEDTSPKRTSTPPLTCSGVMDVTIYRRVGTPHHLELDFPHNSAPGWVYARKSDDEPFVITTSKPSEDNLVFKAWLTYETKARCCYKEY